MANRFSTDSVKRLGSLKTVVYDGEQFRNTFSNSSGFEVGLEPSSVAFANPGAVSESINGEKFYAAKSFFYRKGFSETSAITLALLILDSSKASGVSVMKILHKISSDDKVMFDYVTYAQVNLFRPASTQQGELVLNDNKGSVRRRLIID